MQQPVSFGQRGATAAPAMATAVPPTNLAAPAITSAEDRAFGRAPWASLTILVLLGVAFLLEVTDGPGIKASAVSLSTLLHLGALSRDLVFKDGQVWRLLTAPWLHGGISHIVGNAVALGVIGLLLEPIIGWRWFTAVYALGGVAGSLGSIALNERSLNSVGASGAIMAVMACAVTVALHPASIGRRKRIWVRCGLSGVPALLPMSTASHVDYSAHVGGALLGFVAGYVLLIVWDGRRRQPPLQREAGIAAMAVMVAGLVAVGAAAALPPANRLDHGTAGLIPAEQFPASIEEQMRKASEFVVAYPADPRGHGLMAVAWQKSGGFSEAEAELQKALASPLLHAPEMPPDFERHLRVLLVGEQLKQNEVYAARQSAVALCPDASALDPRVQDALKQLKACDGQ
jgi:membrane associated rhomboid family serine protease